VEKKSWAGQVGLAVINSVTKKISRSKKSGGEQALPQNHIMTGQSGGGGEASGEQTQKGKEPHDESVCPRDEGGSHQAFTNLPRGKSAPRERKKGVKPGCLVIVRLFGKKGKV